MQRSRRAPTEESSREARKPGAQDASTPIPVGALEQHVAIVGRSGSGKSYAARGAVEALLALSYEHASRIEAQQRAEVKELMALAEAADQADIPDGMSVPEELGRREERLRRIAEAKAAIEAGQGALCARAGRASGQA